MGINRKYCRNKNLTSAEQSTELKLSYLRSQLIRNREYFIWTNKFKPSNLSREYSISIEYNGRKPPNVWLDIDSIEKTINDDVPHIYEYDKKNKRLKLCLYKPGYNEWNKTKSIAKTIVPWAIEWLFYFEIWLNTGEWYGGGEHPES